eukprot:6473322-Amphidinium_carterae.1
MHIKDVIAWRKQRQSQREVQALAHKRMKQDLGLKGCRVSANRMSWDDIQSHLGVDTFSLSTCMDPNDLSLSTFVAGDGNCTWRALWMLNPIHSSWRVMKKLVLAVHPHLTAFRPYGTHAGAECIAAFAAYFHMNVQVHLLDSQVLFVPGLDVSHCVHLRIVNHHAQPFARTSAAQARRHLGCVKNEHLNHSMWTPLSVSDVCTSNVEAGMHAAGDPVSDALILNYPRQRRRRIDVSLNDAPNFALFVDECLDMESMIASIARQCGTCRQLVSMHVDGRSLLATCVTPDRNNQTRPFVWKFAVATPLSRPHRNNVTHTLEAFVGHRATRARGLLGATSLIPPATLARAMRSIADALPGFPFSTAGVILHRNIPEHVDAHNRGDAAMITVWGGRTLLRAMSSITDTPITFNTRGNLVVFNPSRAHSVLAQGPCISLVVYHTARDVQHKEAVELRSLGFPVVAEAGCLTPNYSTTQASSASRSSIETQHTRAVTRTPPRSRPTPPSEALVDHSEALVDHVDVGDRFVLTISQTLPFIDEEDEESLPLEVLLNSHLDAGCYHCCVGCEWGQRDHGPSCMHLDSGGIDAAEQSRLTQKVKELGFNYPLRIVRALILLDAKLRKALRDNSHDKERIRVTIEACMKRWNMK